MTAQPYQRGPIRTEVTKAAYRDGTTPSLMLPTVDFVREGSSKSRSRFAAIRGGAFSPYTIPLPAPPRERVVLLAVGEGGALPNGGVSASPMTDSLTSPLRPSSAASTTNCKNRLPRSASAKVALARIRSSCPRALGFHGGWCSLSSVYEPGWKTLARRRQRAGVAVEIRGGLSTNRRLIGIYWALEEVP